MTNVQILWEGRKIGKKILTLYTLDFADNFRNYNNVGIFDKSEDN